MSANDANTTTDHGDRTPDAGRAVVEPDAARMNNPAMVVPDAMAALQAIGAAIAATALPERTIDLVNMRASQINSCGVCLLGHVRHAKAHGETDERLAVLAGWREAPFFTAAERAALALTESVTRLCDRADPVPDDVWDETARHYDEASLAALLMQIANINVWNRLNVATRQVAGAYEW
jgi:AhpD family alkylhydroperoxidase